MHLNFGYINNFNILKWALPYCEDCVSNTFMVKGVAPWPQSQASFQEIINYYHIFNGIIGRKNTRRATTCMPSANVMWEGYEIIILISLPNPPPVRVVWEEQPQALRIDSISPTSFWLHLLSTLPFLTLSLTAPHPNLYSSIPLLIHPFHLFSSSFALLLFFTKIIRLHIQGTSISSEHILSSPSSPLLLLHFFQELAQAMLFQIIQLLKLILS